MKKTKKQQKLITSPEVTETMPSHVEEPITPIVEESPEDGTDNGESSSAGTPENSDQQPADTPADSSVEDTTAIELAAADTQEAPEGGQTATQQDTQTEETTDLLSGGEPESEEPAEIIMLPAGLLPMAGEGIGAVELVDGIIDGELPAVPSYDSRPLLESLIDFSPRGNQDEVPDHELQAMAVNMRNLKYVIAPITVRIVTEGRYELVTGRVRLMAARIAGIVYIPAVIRQLTDDEVDEWQLSENFHRVDPHIMAQARKVAAMVTEKKKPKEIALILGMSVSAIYTRYQLANLSADFERLYRANILNTKQALALATLSDQFQQKLFDELGRTWETMKSTGTTDIPYIVSRYRCDLKNAMFDTTDDELVPGLKKCDGCKFNLTDEAANSLFKDSYSDGRCGNSACFDQKTWATFSRTLATLIHDNPVSALVLQREPSKELEDVLRNLPEASALKRYTQDEVSVVPAPIEPTEASFSEAYGEGTNEGHEEYQLAVAEFESQMSQLSQAISDGKVILALAIEAQTIEVKMFTVVSASTEAAPVELSADADNTDSPKVAKMTTSQIREAVNEKLVDVQLLRNEISSITAKQSMAEREDTLAVAKKICSEFRDNVVSTGKTKKITVTPADRYGLFSILYDELSYRNRSIANQFLFGKYIDAIDEETISKRARRCLPEDIAFLTRLIMAYSETAKQPSQPLFQVLCEVAQGAGVKVKKLQADSEATIENRRKRNNARIAEIKRVIAQHEAPKPEAKKPAAKSKAAATKGVNTGGIRSSKLHKPGKQASKAVIRKASSKAHAKRA